MDYKSAGVNIDEGNRAVERIKTCVQSTHSPAVLSNIGGFSAGFEFPINRYTRPVLVSATDGIGTKLLLAIEHQSLDTVGIDCVAMCVNDLICMGADPLFFLDYIACHKIDSAAIEAIIAGIAKGCRESNCSLIGGEMAEMNTLYKPHDFDVAGFCVGAVDKDRIIDGTAITPGDTVYALASSGFHSNGYSLIRSIIAQTSLLSEVSMDTLLTPTKLYVSTIAALKKAYTLKGIAHITGGGIAENLARILPASVTALLQKDAFQTPDMFHLLQRHGSVDTNEMYRVFNMGIGMIIVSSDRIDSADCFPIGKIIAGNKEVTLV